MTNPACGLNTTGWAPTGGTLSRLTALTGIPRTEGARVTSTGTANVTNRFLGAIGDIVAGGKLYLSSYVRCSSALRSIGTIIDWYNGASYVSSSGGTFATLAANTWVRRSEALTVPASINRWQVTVQMNTPAVSDTVDITCVLLEPDIVLNAYADGESPGWVWAGTRFNALSNDVPSPHLRQRFLRQAVNRAANW